MTEVVLRTEGLTRHFGGLAAVSDVSIAVASGQVHAVIGPNGAGKSTLANLLSGDLPPSAGRVLLRGSDITGLPAHRIAQLGVGRSYQKTNIFLPFTVFENCRLAAQSRLPGSMRFFRPASGYRQINALAEAALVAAGLETRAGVTALEMSHGEQRQLEIAMTLATDPSVLLLDEPLAGMGADESGSMVDLLRRLRAGHAILLIEHDMDAVFSLADTLTVMVNGVVLESGTPEQIRMSPLVQEAYLGSDEVLHE